jgi:hypothetical protein
MSHALTAKKTPLTDAQERFAAHYATFGSPVDAYRASYDVVTSNVRTMRTQASRLLAHPAITARVVALRNAQAADGESLSKAVLIADLEAMVDVDPSTLMDVATVPCGLCWPDDMAIAKAAARAMAAREPMPAFDQPRSDCPACVGSGRLVGHITPTAQLPLAARRLIKGIEFYDGGGVKRVVYHDQATLRTELHKLRGLHVDRSVSLNLNAELKPLKRGMSVDEALAIMESIAPTEPAALPAAAIDAEFTEVSTQP